MSRNITIASVDTRNIKNVLYEKSVFGAAPTHYKLDNDDDWHPIQFVDNRRLTHVQFSDGTTINVMVEKNHTLETLNEIFRERNDANTLDGVAADIESATAAAMTAEATANDYYQKESSDEREHFSGVGDSARILDPDLYRGSTSSMTQELRGKPFDAMVIDELDPTPGAESAELVDAKTDLDAVDTHSVTDFLTDLTRKE